MFLSQIIVLSNNYWIATFVKMIAKGESMLSQTTLQHVVFSSTQEVPPSNDDQFETCKGGLSNLEQSIHTVVLGNIPTICSD